MQKILSAALCMALSLPLLSAVLCEKTFQTEEDLKAVYDIKKGTAAIAALPDGTKALEIVVPENSKETKNIVSIHLKGDDIRGKRVAFSAEIKCDMSLPVDKWGGGLFVVWAPAPKGQKGVWEHRYVGAEKKGWRKFELNIDMPPHVTYALLQLGISGARGKIYYRNVKVVSGDMLIPLNTVANMGFADDIAGDHKGGWHDQGSDHDASKFPFKNKAFANVPFSVVDPKTNGGKAIVVFECPKLPDGAKSAELKLNSQTEGRYLYLLHCSAWGQPKGSTVGTIELESINGKKAVLPVVYGKDLVEWWGAKPAENAVIGAHIAAKGGNGAAYVSRFTIPDGFGKIDKIVFRKQPGANAMWMLIGATLSDTAYKYPESQKLVMKADAVWKALPQKFAPTPKAGTALDFSGFYPAQEAGEFGRVVIGKDGHFEFEKRPGEVVRFQSACMGRDFGNYFGVPMEMKDKKMIEAYADQIQRAGYNMVRFWASVLKEDGGAPGEGWKYNKAFQFSPSVVDRVDYFFHCLKKRGIYVFLSIQIASAGIDNCYPWGDPRMKEWDLYRNKHDFDAWCKSTEQILTHLNPYTKTRWIDDPQIAMIDCNNEQEFAFIRADDRYAGLFREFLKKKYKTIAALKNAWGADGAQLKEFDDIKTFRPLGTDKPGRLNQDRADFMTEQERGLYNRETAHLRKLGYKGPTTSFLMVKSMRYAGVRKEFDFVAQNGYHTHPTGGTVTKGCSVAQASSIGASANIIRSFIAARLYNKPFVVTEHGHVFWNKYRYEQGFIMGGFAALNAFDGLTAFFMPVTTHPNQRITSFEIRHDPVGRASELMTNLLFRRGDVKPADFAVRIRMNADEVVRSNAVTDGINSNQLCMGLAGQCSIDQTALPLKPNELAMDRIGASGTAVRTADSNVVDTKGGAFDMDRVLKTQKARNLIPSDNRTSAEKEIFESATGELFMDCGKNFMKIETPRFQGICGEAGSAAKLKNFEVKSMNRRGSVALASIDGTRNLDNAKRMLLFVVTNVLNSGMSFENTDQRTRIDVGTTPLLLETGTFSMALRNANADRLKLYALALDGTRIDELPVRKINGGIEFTIDTAKIKDGPGIYFELAEK